MSCRLRKARRASIVTYPPAACPRICVIYAFKFIQARRPSQAFVPFVHKAFTRNSLFYSASKAAFTSSDVLSHIFGLFSMSKFFKARLARLSRTLIFTLRFIAASN